MPVQWHTFQLGRVLSSVPPARILPTPARLPHSPRCARRSTCARTTSTAVGSRTCSRGRRSAAMADDAADAAPHSDSSDHVLNGGMPNGGAVPEHDGPAAISPSASGARTLPSNSLLLVLCRSCRASVPHPRGKFAVQAPSV